MPGYLDRKVDEILEYLGCKTVKEGLKKLDDIEKGRIEQED